MTDQELVAIDNIIAQILYGDDADDCMAHDECQHAVALMREHVIPIIAKREREKVLQEIYKMANGRSSAHALIGETLAAAVVRDIAKERYGLEL